LRCSGWQRLLRSGWSLRQRLRLEEVLRRPDGLVQEAPPRRLLREERLLCSGSQLLRSG